MSKTIEVYVRRGWINWSARLGNVFMYGSRGQMQSDRELADFCYSIWTRKTSIKLSDRKPKHIRITFEEIPDE